MTNMNKSHGAAIAAALIALLPASATVGVRAGDNKPPASTSAKVAPVSATQGPKGGFPNSPGLEIARIKANENAAFKRKSNGT